MLDIYYLKEKFKEKVEKGVVYIAEKAIIQPLENACDAIDRSIERMDRFDEISSQYGVGVAVVDRIKHTEIVSAIIEDPVLEGRKLGYERAAKEYKPIIKELKDNLKKAKTNFESNDRSLEVKLNEADVLLERLETEKKDLWNKINSRINNKNHNTDHSYSIQNFTALASSAALRSKEPYDFYLLEGYLSNKRKRKSEAEEAGYQEAKEEHLRKIEELKKEFNDFIKSSENVINNKMNLILKYYEEIAIVKTAITEMKLYEV